MDIFEGLNSAQREAVASTEGYIRVVAGAGSGKTRALARRFAYLVNDLGVTPGSILCVTFTNKSAAEMRQRIRALTGDSDTGHICTFHSFCVTVLQEDSHAVQYPKSFLVLDNADIDAMLALIYEERGLTLRHMTYSDARDMIEIRKGIEDPEYYLDMIDMDLETLHRKYLDAVSVRDIIFYGYLYEEKKCFGLDYNDLIFFTLYIFQQDREIRQKWQERLQYIMVDEFQDIDKPQYRLMRALCGYHRNLFIVGDPDQTIYTWRGASVKYLLDFDKEFPGTRTIMMMQNYRSTPEILAAANSLIAQNRNRMKKELTPTLPSGAPVVWMHCESPEDEAGRIAERIMALHDEGVPYRDMTLLYRAHYVTRTIEEVFIRLKLPYVIYSGVQFFSRAEVKDALSYLRLIAYRDDLSFMRVANVPRRNLGRRRMEFLREYAAKNACSLYDALCRCLDDELFRGTKARRLVSLVEELSAGCEGRSIAELLSEVLNRSGYEEYLRTEGSQERLDNLAELKQSVREYEETSGEECSLTHYLSHVALFSNSDADTGRDAVKLMTIHAAKGLEFPYVFLCCLNEGILPSKKTDSPEGMEEERRLAFVALTRARRGLVLSDSEGRGHDGAPRYPSRFLLEIDRGLLVQDGRPRESLVSEAREYISAHTARLSGASDAPQELFAPGDRVRHAAFGDGTVLEVDAARRVYVIKFDKTPTPRTLTLRVRLQRI
ncbi:MAG: ATP-dependent helicase [Oscillospiraceae bacterium]